MRTIASRAVTIATAACLLAGGPALAQEERPDQETARTVRQLQSDIADLVGHVEQMRNTVREDPSLRRQMGNRAELESVLATGRLLGTVAGQLGATIRQTTELLRGRRDTLSAPVRREYRRLRESLGAVVESLAGSAARYDSLRKALHASHGG